MRKSLFLALPLLGMALVAPQLASAQGVYVTPALGVYIPADDLYSLRAGAERVRVEKNGTLALGVNVDLGKFRGTLAYASGSEIDSISGRNLGEGKLLAVAADYVLRPIPRLIVVQPYVLFGAGLRREDYSYESGVSDAFPSDESSFALHVGLGLDVTLGRFGIVGEFTDFLSKEDGDNFGRHDAFGMIGLKMRLF